MVTPSSFQSVVLVALPLTLAACGGTLDAGGPSQANPLDDQENAVIHQLQQVRTTAKVGAVTVCTSLNVSASTHSDDMRDNNYLSDVPPSDPTSTVRTRACSAGYKPSCGTTIPMAELVASGNGTGDMTLAQWSSNPMSQPILVNPAFTVVGVGRSIGADGQKWTLDLASMPDASCN